MRCLLYISIAVALPSFAVPVVADDDDAAPAVAPAEEAAPLSDPLQEIARRRNLAARARSNGRTGNYTVPVEVDLSHNVERFLVILPDRPLLIDAVITIDGEPFHAHRESMVSRLLKSADAEGDADGEVTWEELLASHEIARSRLANLLRTDQQKQSFVDSYDVIKNGTVEPFEARTALATAYGGPALAVYDYGNRATGNATAVSLSKLLDEDEDGTLSADELAAAEQHLASRDADDNEIVEIAELYGTSGGLYGGRVLAVNGGNRPAGPSLAPPASRLYHIAPEMNWLLVLEPLTKFLQLGDRLPPEAAFVRQLDADESGSINAREAMALLTMEPHLSLEVTLGEGAGGYGSIALRSPADRLAGGQLVSADSKGISLEFPGVKFEATAVDYPARYSNYSATAKAMLSRYDMDKNGYLEEKEFGSQQARFAQQFAQWDADGDGKVYVEEIEKAYLDSYLPTLNRVSVGAAEMGDSLLSAVDQNGDGRLGLREIRTASERLLTTDLSGDGALSPEEVPVTIRFAVARSTYITQAFGYGRAAYGGGFVGGNFGGQPPDTGGQNGPRWFFHMDTNGDGDLTPPEFLGSAEQFAELDANGDGFVERSEAENAATTSR